MPSNFGFLFLYFVICRVKNVNQLLSKKDKEKKQKKNSAKSVNTSIVARSLSRTRKENCYQNQTQSQNHYKKITFIRQSSNKIIICFKELCR